NPAGAYGGRLRLLVVLSGLAKRRVQGVLVYLEIEGALGDPELFGDLRQVALASRDGCADGVALDGVKMRSGGRLRPDVRRASRCGDRKSDLFRKRCCSDGVIVGQHHHPFDHVSHFAYVSRPCVSFEGVHDVRLEPFHGAAMAMRHLAAEILDQLGDVLRALPQRGDAERRHRYTVEQVLAKTTGGDLCTEIPVGRGDQLELNVARLARPERIQFSSSRTRRRYGCSSSGISLISSRNNVPSRAASI